MRSADYSIDTIHAHSISELSLAGTAEGKVGDTRTGAPDVTAASFIDLSDDDKRPIPLFSPRSFPSSPQLSSSLDTADSMLYRRAPEEDRRRRREKIAKLHRFLGSRVPTSLVLGFSASDDTLPALEPTTIDDVRTSRHNRRRSSSAAETRGNWFGPDDRMKEELDEHEKAINVRRALKMEKMFGVQPPQTLYHTRTRHSPRPKDRVHSTERPSSEREREAVLPANRNINQGSYLNKDGKQSRYRASSHSRSHSESMPLLDPVASSSSGKRASAVYMHYRYSLNSLSDIIDRDDRESLAELHSILTNDQSGSDGSTPVPRDDDNNDGNNDARTIRSERRRSLPTRSSTISLASQFSLGSPSPERTPFQARRRQAAKLTHFFGVDYRELIGDILESIERYVQEESRRGTLRPEEIQDLVVKLRKLRTKRTALI